MRDYIHHLASWPIFRWRTDALVTKLGEVRHQQERLMGRMSALGFSMQSEAVLSTLTQDVLKSSEIEGEHLDRKQVRSSIARRLGLEVAGLVPSDRNIDGMVEMMLDATQNYAAPLSKERLFAWHASIFPTGRSGMTQIRVGNWRNDEAGPMQVVSGPFGRERVHFEAPAASRLEAEMNHFIDWFESGADIDPVLKAGLAHLWFVTIHPFDDGNGRIARAIADLALSRAEKTTQRFYSMSAQIRQERKTYYDLLEANLRGDLDITRWLQWFLDCLSRACMGAEQTLQGVLGKAAFWERFGSASLNERQRAMLNRLLDGFEGKLTSSKWAKITKVSGDTALRDIQDLVQRRVLIRDEGGGRNTSYSLHTL